MKRMRYLRFRKRIAALMIILALVLSSSITTMAAPTGTGIYIGSGNVNYANGALNFEVRSFITYNENTPEHLDLSSMVQWILNDGALEVNEICFEAHDELFTNYVQTRDTIKGIKTGESRRIEADWESICASEGKSHVYEKNGNDKSAYTDMVSGNSISGLGGWSSFWFQTRREDEFHY